MTHFVLCKITLLAFLAKGYDMLYYRAFFSCFSAHSVLMKPAQAALLAVYLFEKLKNTEEPL